MSDSRAVTRRTYRFDAHHVRLLTKLVELEHEKEARVVRQAIRLLAAARGVK